MRTVIIAAFILAVTLPVRAEGQDGDKAELLQQINRSLADELCLCQKAKTVCKKMYRASAGRLDTADRRLRLATADLNDCAETLERSNEILKKKEEENRTLRRRVAGQTNVLRAVSAAAVAALLFILL